MGAAEAPTESQLVAAGTADPSLPGTPQAVDHYNMCSAACGPGVRPHTRDLVVWLAERNRPAALSLNEACYDDAVHLTGRLPTMTAGAAYSALDTAVGCPGAVKRFGNMVLVGEGLEAHTAWWAPFRTQAGAAVGAEGVPCDHRTDECRGVVCIDAGRPGVRSLAARRAYCSAHLESPRRDAEVADAQTSEYGEMVAARFDRYGARVLAGDFNLERSDTDDVLRPAGYRAAASGPTVGSRPDGADEIDRIYDDGPGAAEATVTSHCDRQASDHCYLTTAPPPASVSEAVSAPAFA
jgi:endonuclease/exonuclease/phosphatase family metal-dependent hydrolase